MVEQGKVWPVIIIGAAPSGLSAAIFTARRGLTPLIITKNIGGQLATTIDVDNYPGLDYVTGSDLSMTMSNQAKKYGATIVIEEVEKIMVLPTDTRDHFVVKCTHSDYEAESVIIASGKTPRNLGVPGEEEFLGKGVSYAASTELPLYQDKVIAIVGGGNSAFTAVRLATPLASQINLIHRRPDFRAEKVLVDECLAHPKVNKLVPYGIAKINGDSKITSITVTNLDTNKTEELPCDAVFIEIGFEINRNWFHDVVNTTPTNQIIVNQDQETSKAGIFAAGDVTNTPFNQAIISAGDGAKAGLAAYRYLTGRPIGADWGK